MKIFGRCTKKAPSSTCSYNELNTYQELNDDTSLSTVNSLVVGKSHLTLLGIVLIEPQPRHASVDDILHTRWQHNFALDGKIDCIQH